MPWVAVRAGKIRRPDSRCDARRCAAHGLREPLAGRGRAAAVSRALPSGATIRAVSPPYLVATKLEAFSGRGAGEHLVSRDLEDVVALADGRAEIVEEVRLAPGAVRDFLAV
jgi:hypothetical protein